MLFVLKLFGAYNENQVLFNLLLSILMDEREEHIVNLNSLYCWCVDANAHVNLFAKLRNMI